MGSAEAPGRTAFDPHQETSALFRVEKLNGRGVSNPAQPAGLLPPAAQSRCACARSREAFEDHLGDREHARAQDSQARYGELAFAPWAHVLKAIMNDPA